MKHNFIYIILYMHPHDGRKWERPGRKRERGERGKEEDGYTEGMKGSSKERRKQQNIHTCMYAHISSVWQLIQVHLTKPN